MNQLQIDLIEAIKEADPNKVLSGFEAIAEALTHNNTLLQMNENAFNHLVDQLNALQRASSTPNSHLDRDIVYHLPNYRTDLVLQCSITPSASFARLILYDVTGKAPDDLRKEWVAQGFTNEVIYLQSISCNNIAKLR